MLEEVGGLQGYWENDSHWKASLVRPGFGPQEKVTDSALLEVAARRAVVESLAVQESAKDAETPGLTTAWSRGGREDANAALAAQINVAEDGSATLSGNVSDIVSRLAAGAEPTTPFDGAMEAGEARELIGTWDSSWTSVSLSDDRLKFAVRIPSSDIL